MTVSRRLFLKAVSGAALITSLSHATKIFAQNRKVLIRDREIRGGTYGIPAADKNDPLYYYNSAAFSAYTGSIFRVWISNRKYIDLKLAEVSELKNPVPGKDGFALLFVDSRVNRLASGLYKIEHAAMGSFSLTLNAVNRKGTDYEAVINRQYP